jgi:hypothetical protein
MVLKGDTAMEITVVVEPVNNNGFRARSVESVALEAHGATADEAVVNLRALLAARMTASRVVVAEDVAGTSENPWLKLAGTHQDDDPMIRDWEKNIADYRREIDEDANVP